MRVRKAETLEDLKKDPDLRIGITKPDYQSYIDLCRISRVFRVSAPALARAILLIWIRERNSLEVKGAAVHSHPLSVATRAEIRDRQNLQIVQQLHGLDQVSLFSPVPKEDMRESKNWFTNTAGPGRLPPGKRKIRKSKPKKER